VDFNTLHTTHGRAIPFATGIKLANPELTVIVVTGDGDATAIGGNHFIHAARRNIDITVVLYNNWIYGMTGGQVSPTTPHGRLATTAPHGNPEGSFDISNLAIAAGASFVARGTVTTPIKLGNYIEKGIRKKGFSLIEAFTPCPTAFGRPNKLGAALENMEWMKRNTIDVKKTKDMSHEELEGKLVTGILTDVEKPEYTALYDQLIERLKTEKGGLDLPERETIRAGAPGQEGEEL
jgi:2-oxoglutarate ferredoxin oxidoreductase subunit beta